MLLPALLTATVVAASDGATLSPEIQEFSRQATEWVLAGKDLPRDFRQRLMEMPPGDRLQALVILRRSGLLETETWSLDDLLREAEAKEQIKP